MDIEDLFKGNVAAGLAVGVGALLLGPQIGRIARRAAKTALKGGIMVYDKGADAVGQLNVGVHDLIDETRLEMMDKGRKEGEPSGSEPQPQSGEGQQQQPG